MVHKLWYGIWSMLLWTMAMQQQIKPPTLTVVPGCDPSSQPLMVMYGNRKLGSGGSEKQTFNDLTFPACSQACATNTSPTGEAITCAGFEYNADSKTCTTYAAFDPDTLTDDPSTKFVQKTCLDSPQGCQSPFQFEATPQMVLVGFARQVLPVQSPNACLKECLEAYTTKGYECQSAMYYPRDQECILNVESRYTRPDVFTAETRENVLYFDNNCAGSTCYSPFVTGYTKTSNIQLTGVNGISLPGKSLQACEWLCTHRIAQASGEQYSCKSFLYHSSDQTCTLLNERLRPLGRAEPSPAEGTDYYEKGCYSSKMTCRNPPSFTRFPGMVLVGFAAYVVEAVPSVTRCLDLCLSPPPETSATSFKCKSVMYYYNEQECILNSETRETHPDVFVPEGTGFRADYFDIMCLEGPEMCPSGTNTSAIRIPDSKIAPNSNITLKDAQAGTPEECRDMCYQESPEKCRSYNYDTGTQQCTLLLINSDSAFPAPADGNDVYDLICLPGDVCPLAAAFDRVPLKANPSSPSKSLDAPTALPDCLGECLNEMCVGVNYNVFSGQCDLFTTLSRLRRQNPTETSTSSPSSVPRPGLIDNPSIDWYQNNCAGGQAGVETICTFDGMKVIVRTATPITGAVFGKMKYDTCRVEVKEARMAMLTLGFQVDRPITGCGDDEDGGGCGGARPAAGYGYGAGGGYGGGGGRGCAGGFCNGPLGPPFLPSKDCGVVDLKNGTYKATIVVQSNNLGIPGLVTSMDQLYDVSCDYSAVQAKKIQANATLHVEGPTPALIHPRGRIMIGSPVSMQLTGGGGFAALQAKLGDLLELHWEMMALDDDMDFFVRRCIAEPGTVSVPVGRPGQQGGGKKGGSCPGGDCTLSGGIPPGIADLGTSNDGGCAGGDCQLLGGPTGGGGGGIPLCPGGDCRVLGGPPQGSLEGQLPGGQQLLLIDNGCPTSAASAKLMPGPVSRGSNKTKTAPLQAFRFDGSRSVRIICQLDICVGQCNPTTCVVAGKPATSYGRKKRQMPAPKVVKRPPGSLDNEEDEEEEAYVSGEYLIPKRTHAMASIVILDPNDDNVHDAVTANKRRASAQRAVDDQLLDTLGVRISSGNKEKLCMRKSIFFGAFLFLACIASVQAAAVGIIISRRFFPKK